MRLRYVHPVTTESKPWTQEMVIVHRVFRREFRLMAGRVRTLPPGGSDAVKRVADHIVFGLTMLEHHHHTEDGLVWPKLRARCAARADLVQRMEDQHHRVDVVVHRTREHSRPRDRARRRLRLSHWPFPWSS